MTSLAAGTHRTQGQPSVYDEDAGLVTARMGTLLTLASPVDLDLWRVGPVTLADVTTHLTDVGLRPGGLCADHATLKRDPDPLDRPACRPCEVGRVAWLYNRPAMLTSRDDPHPVTLDAGFGPFIPDWPFTDGNHRLLAAALLVATGQLAATGLLVVRIVGDWDRGVALLVDEVDPDEAYDRL